MKKPLVIVSILAIALLSASCSFLWDAGIEGLAEGLRLQLKNREFGKIYDEASEHMKMNVSREKFLERAGKIVEEMEKLDKALNWQSDNTLGKTTDVDKYVTNTYYGVFKKLGEDTETMFIFVTWEEKPNDRPRLFNLSAMSHPNAQRPFHLITAGELVGSK